MYLFLSSDSFFLTTDFCFLHPALSWIDAFINDLFYMKNIRCTFWPFCGIVSVSQTGGSVYEFSERPRFLYLNGAVDLEVDTRRIIVSDSHLFILLELKILSPLTLE